LALLHVARAGLFLRITYSKAVHPNGLSSVIKTSVKQLNKTLLSQKGK